VTGGQQASVVVAGTRKVKKLVLVQTLDFKQFQAKVFVL